MANAWQWTARAYQFGWQVSSQPQVGWIMDLQPFTGGAYGLGHVGVVEQVLSDGRFIASSANWNGSGATPISATFHTGPGVTFLHN